jgi:hypothetical protein
MSGKDRYYAPKPQSDKESTPFQTAEEAWFWFIQAMQAKAEGAKIAAGLSAVTRPCEPVDILATLERLYRNRRILMDHILVLRCYGRRQLPPDPRHVKEMRADTLWKEGLRELEDALVKKGIVAKLPWYSEASLENALHV